MNERQYVQEAVRSGEITIEHVAIVAHEAWRYWMMTRRMAKQSIPARWFDMPEWARADEVRQVSRLIDGETMAMQVGLVLTSALTRLRHMVFEDTVEAVVREAGVEISWKGMKMSQLLAPMRPRR